ncbi:DUF3667 domain-containing protein [Parvularcula marina]|uniref:DUF3667 domain-containing protein n=1 Tax=Parvularcula marina TaxID=2292771 RepID=UPI003512D41F
MRDTLKTWRQRGMEMRKLRREAKSPNRSHCQNCETKLQGAYCFVCGQAAREPRRAVIGLVQDVFVETLAIDGKLFRTIALLMRAPGKLARKFLDGQRVRYSPPFRLYLFASVFFFLAAFWDLGHLVEGANLEKPNKEVSTENSEETAETPPLTEEELSEVPPEEGEASESDDMNFSLFGDEDEDKHEWMIELEDRMGDALKRATEDPRLFMAQTRENLPRFLLLAPLVYALTLMLLYIYRRKFFIYDHFVVSLYMHAALYAYLLIAIVWSKIPIVGFLWWVPLVWGALQPLLVQRQAYGSNWFSAVIKWVFVNAVYWIAMLIIILLGLGFSLYQS